MRQPSLGTSGTSDSTGPIAFEILDHTGFAHASDDRPPTTVARKRPRPILLGSGPSMLSFFARPTGWFPSVWQSRGMSPGPRANRFILLAAILGTSIVFVDGTVVNVALPTIQHDLGGGLAAQQWVVDAYLLTLGSLILLGGSLGDIFGETRVFTIGVTSFGFASVLCAVAPDVTTLIVFRGLQGLAGALLTPASLAVLTSTFSGTERGAAIGSWTAGAA